MNRCNDFTKILVGTRLFHRTMKDGPERIVVVRQAGPPRWVYEYEDEPGHVSSCGDALMRQPSKFRHAGDAPARPLPVVEIRQPAPDAAPAVIVRPAPATLPALDPAVSAAPATASERIAVDPEDLGVVDYEVRGRRCVIVSDVERALAYEVKSLVKLIRGDWSDELVDGEDFAVITFAEAKEMREKSRVPAVGTLNPRGLMVLFEGGFDFVLLRTEKPEGAALRQRLRDKVLPKLRRGQAVGTTGEAVPPVPALTEARVAEIIAASLASAIPLLVRELRPLLVPTMTASPLPVQTPSNEIPRSWITAQTIAAILSLQQASRISEAKVNTAIRALGVREDPERAAHRMVPQASSGVTYAVPSWRYAPEVTEMVAQRLFPAGPVQAPLPGAG